MPMRSPAASLKVRPLKRVRVPILRGDVQQIDHAVGQLWRGRDEQLDVHFLLGAFLAGDLVIAVDPVPGFRPARPGAAAHPLELPLEEALALVLLHILARGTLGARGEVIGVIPLVADEFPARQLDDARGDAVEEIAVVRDKEARARVAAQEVLEPGDALGIEVVGRLVEDQEVGLLDERAAERDAALLAAGEVRDEAVRARGVLDG